MLELCWAFSVVKLKSRISTCSAGVVRVSVFVCVCGGCVSVCVEYVSVYVVFSGKQILSSSSILFIFFLFFQFFPLLFPQLHFRFHIRSIHPRLRDGGIQWRILLRMGRFFLERISTRCLA